MRAVVLDGYTLNPGDLNWDELKTLCDLTVYDRTAYDVSGLNEIIKRVYGSDHSIINWSKKQIEILTFKKLKAQKEITV